MRANAVLELDLSHVGEIDSAGLQLLALAKQRSANRNTIRCTSSGTARRCAKSSSFSTWSPSSAIRW
jgi:ABC-type transporter Mla MlaB component